METLIFIDSLFLMPFAVAAIVAAIVLLIVRGKKKNADPAAARVLLIVALLLFLFAFAALIVFPLLYLLYLVLRFGPSLIFAGLKSL